jgi:hypothetical protein
VSATQTAAVGALGLALYAGHHWGDYWTQTDHQARHKGDAGADGAMHCALHVLSYLATQVACLFLVVLATGVHLSAAGVLAGLAVSGVTHYLADRREHGIMLRLARLLPGKAAFLELGKPRDWHINVGYQQNTWSIDDEPVDNPQLATGAWALDQAWHIFWGVFVAALLMAGLS